MTRPAYLPIVLRALVAAALLVVAALGWTGVRYGWSADGLAARASEEVRETVSARVARVRGLALAVSAEAPLVDQASDSRERLAILFARLGVLASPAADNPAAATVFVPAAPAAVPFRVLAWSDGPGEQSLAADRLAGPRALFVAPGHAGLRLVAVEPIVLGDRRLGAAVAETVIAPASRRIETTLGPVEIVERYASTGPADDGLSFTVSGPDGAPLVDVRIDIEVLEAHRSRFLKRTVAVALVPIPIALTLVALILASRRTTPALGRPWRRSLRFVLAATSATLVYAGLARLAALPVEVSRLALAVGLLVVTSHVAGLVWRRTAVYRHAQRRPWRFVVEHVAGGLLLAVGLESVARLLDWWITLDVLARGPFVLFPLSLSHTVSTGVVLLVETALSWAIGSVLAVLAVRWRVAWTIRVLPTLACWLLPVAALHLAPWSSARLAGPFLLIVAAAAASGALATASLRRVHRRSTRSARLLLALLAGLVPPLLLYPLAALEAMRTTVAIVETNYAPATATHPQEMLAELTRAQMRIDEMAGLEQLVSGPSGSDSQAAYIVWSQTGLEQSRVISDVELYGPDRTLVSRFAFNLPEYVYRTALQPWHGTSCSWEGGVFGEAPRFGSEVRRMLHAERGVCDASGRLLGGIVVHVARDDYEALPFLSSPSPYTGAPGETDTGPRLPGVRLVVYGWSFRPSFTSSVGSWAVPQEMFERLYRTGEPFWTEAQSDNSTFDVHLSQNRSGIYAIGVPRVPLIEHGTRLAEIAVLVAVFFVAWQAVLLAHSSLARQPQTPLRQMLHEVRTSFYRKLFLSFVAVAVVPVVVAAFTFGGYMTARFRADVEYEAGTTVAVAQRVFQELTASPERSVEALAEPSDDVMVWIRQVIGHDVNLFDGPELRMTSQRDLVYSGFLPLRLPAAVYRAIALERRPSFVAEDRIGPYSFVVAAAPVEGAGPDTLITVPLAPRQRELERDRDTLNRRVLVGAVFVVLLAALVGASLAGRISDPVARLTRATRQIAAGRLDVRVATDTADELRRLVDDFNSMAATLGAQRDELARTHQLKAWNEMARQVAHEIKNPLTPIQLAGEHLQQVHTDSGRPLGDVLDRCIATVLGQVRLLRQIASEFANFAGEPRSRPGPVDLAELVEAVIAPYRVGLYASVVFDVQVPADLPLIEADRTLLSRALTNLVENAIQAMPNGGRLQARAHASDDEVVLEIVDTGVGMDAAALAHAFEPFFSTKTGGSGLGLANARRNIEREGGTVSIESAPGAGTTLRVRFPTMEQEPPATP